MERRTGGHCAAIAAFCWLAAAPTSGTEHVGDYSCAAWKDYEGATLSFINAMAQDAAGYLWLGTNSRLVRFDGIRFVPSRPVNDPAAFDAGVRSLAVGADGALWVGLMGRGGIVVLRDNRVTTRDTTPGPPLGSNPLLLRSHDGAIWAITGEGASRFDTRWHPIRFDAGRPRPDLYSVYGDRGGRVWVTTSSGLFRSAPDNDALLPVDVTANARALVEDRDGGLWTATEHALLRITANAPATPAHALASALLRDRTDSFWVGTAGNGLLQATPDGSGSHVVREIARRASGCLTHDMVLSLLEDREGNVWVGTLNGLNRFSPRVVRPLHDSPPGLSSDRVRVVATAGDGTVWFGTNEGLFRSGTEPHRFDQASGLQDEEITALHVNHAGALWAASGGGGIDRFTGTRFERVLPAKLVGAIRAFTTDNRGNVWFSDPNRGVVRWQNGALAPVPTPSPPRASTAALTDRSGQVWLGLDDGRVFAFDGARLTAFGPREGLLGRLVTTIFEDSEGTIWIATSGGMTRLAANGPEQRTADTKPGTDMTAILQGDAGFLWTGFADSVTRVHPRDYGEALRRGQSTRATLFTLADGLPGSPVWLGQSAATRTRDGLILFVTTQGVAEIDPRDVNRTSEPVPLRVENIVADGEASVPRQDVRLRAGTSRLQIDYTGLSLAASTQLRFYYRLDGFDSDWIYAGSRRQAFYTNLPPGDYQFRLTGGPIGAQHNPEVAWRFSIEPRFYQTRLFYLFTALGFAGLAGGAWRLRERRLHERHAIVLAERSRISREIHDTLLQNLASVALKTGVIADALKPAGSPVMGELQQMRKDVEACIRHARESVWNLRRSRAQRASFVSELRNALQHMADARQARLVFTVRGAPRPYPAPIEEALLRIGQEAAVNSLRHARAQEVTAELSYGDDGLTLRVTDNGCGFDLRDASQDGVGHYGLSIMRERAEQAGVQLTITTRPLQGTVVAATAAS